MRLATIAFAALPLFTLSSAGTQYPAQPPRDLVRRPDPVGTAVVRGHVLAADTGQPLGRVTVTLAGAATGPRAPLTAEGRGGRGVVVGQTPQGAAVFGTSIRRQATTDQFGAFAFTQLPAGTYRVDVSQPQYLGQYLGMAYGGTRPIGAPGGGVGKPIQLSDGQLFDKADVALPRGAVISGRVTDEAGFALSRVQVYGLYFAPGTSRGFRMGGATTDDLGQYRLFGLQPGEYAVVAEARNMTFVSPNSPLETASAEEPTGYITTYYPAAPDESGATRVRTASGRETPGIEIRIVTGRMYRITGLVIDSRGQPASGANGQLMRAMNGGVGISTIAGFSTDAQGRFRMQNVPAGDYRLVVRLRPERLPPRGQPPEPVEMAIAPLPVGSDLDNLVITTTEGATMSGRVVFEPSPPDTSQGGLQLRVMAQYQNPQDSIGVPSPPPAEVQADMTFTLKGLMGPHVLRVSGLRPTWYIKSITAGADDVLDSPREFTSRDSVTVLISTRAGALEGTVTDAAGAPATETAVMLIGEDKATWTASSLWTHRAPVGPQGRFEMKGLRPGRYYILAVTRDQLNVPMMGSDQAFFEELSKQATTVLVNEDERRTIDLKVAGGGQ